MKKNTKSKIRNKEAASDILDGSYVEIQERDFLDNQAAKEEEEKIKNTLSNLS